MRLIKFITKSLHRFLQNSWLASRKLGAALTASTYLKFTLSRIHNYSQIDLSQHSWNIQYCFGTIILCGNSAWKFIKYFYNYYKVKWTENNIQYSKNKCYYSAKVVNSMACVHWLLHSRVIKIRCLFILQVLVPFAATYKDYLDQPVHNCKLFYCELLKFPSAVSAWDLVGTYLRFPIWKTSIFEDKISLVPGLEFASQLGQIARLFQGLLTTPPEKDIIA